MIILITGTPGSGKTLYTVAELLAKQFKDRPLLVNGIPGLLLEHTPLDDEDVTHWHEGGRPVYDDVIDNETGELIERKRRPPAFDVKNAVIVVDEVQRLARTRSPSSPIPPWISSLETHRHKGCDFIFITQQPQQMDVHIRRLVGRWLHVRRTWGLGSAVVYETDNAAQAMNLKQAQTKVWRYPKKAFQYYKSSELHTKAGGKIPPVIWVVGIAALAFPFLTYEVVKRLGMKTGENTAAIESSAAKAGGPQPTINGAASSSSAPKIVTAADYVAHYRPRISGLAHTAPAYDAMTQPVTVPLPVACLESKKASWIDLHKGTCGCYMQNGTTPYPTTQEICRQIVRQGLFLPFQAPEARPSTAGPSTGRNPAQPLS